MFAGTLVATSASMLPTRLLLAADLRDVAADSSLLLLVGGLSMLTLIVILVILQNLVPDRSARPIEGNQGRGLRPLEGGPPTRPERRRTGKARRNGPVVPAVDRALDRILETHLGEPRLLRSLDRFVRVRLYECRGCRGATARTGCGFERGAVEEAFTGTYRRKVSVRETVCRCSSGGPCDFEVKL